MANTIKQKRGTTDPGASDLVVGELAINTTDGGVFTKTDGGTVVEVGSGGGGASAINDLSDAVTNSSGESIGLGTGALANDDGSSNKNTAVGYQAANALTTGSLSVAVGYQALKTATTDHSNVALGYQAMVNSTASESIAIGRVAQRKTTASGNISIGYFAHYDLTSGGSNIAIGNQAGANQTTGNSNVCIGAAAFDAATTASNSVAVGTRALGANTTASANHAFGYEALESNTTGTNNTAVGYQAGNSITTGNSCVCIGYDAGGDMTVSTGNVFVGKSAGDNVSGAFSNFNTALGHEALSGASNTGGANTALGCQAGDNITSGSNLTCVGNEADASSGTATNEVTLGNSSVATLRCNTQTISSLSDARDKTDVQELPEGLAFINSLNPVKFQWQTRDGNGKDGTYEAGFIAQELQSAQQYADADYLGLVMDSNPDRLEASYGKLVPMLVKAIQELKSEVEQLKANV